MVCMQGSFAGAVVVCMFAGLSGGAHFLGELAIADVVDYGAGAPFCVPVVVLRVPHHVQTNS